MKITIFYHFSLLKMHHLHVHFEIIANTRKQAIKNSAEYVKTLDYWLETLFFLHLNQQFFLKQSLSLRKQCEQETFERTIKKINTRAYNIIHFWHCEPTIIELKPYFMCSVTTIHYTYIVENLFFFFTRFQKYLLILHTMCADIILRLNPIHLCIWSFI